MGWQRLSDGLKGNEIPVTARITATADVFDALNSNRPYKNAFSMEKTLFILNEGRGNHFDPDVVDAFFDIKDEILAIKKYYDEDTDAEGYNSELKALLWQYRH